MIPRSKLSDALATMCSLFLYYSQNNTAEFRNIGHLPQNIWVLTGRIWFYIQILLIQGLV